MRHFSRLKSKNLESEGDYTFEFKRNVETWRDNDKTSKLSMKIIQLMDLHGTFWRLSILKIVWG